MLKEDRKFIRAIKICKLVRKIERLFGKGGTSLPGKIVREKYPDIFEYVFDDYDNIFCVLGTNGKTTTCRMMDNILTQSGIGHIYNREGANMRAGILTTLLLNYDNKGTPKEKTALLECDELEFLKISPWVNPRVIVVTNVYHDQEYRLINVETITNMLIQSILNSPNAIICINSDSEPCMKIASAIIPNRKIFYCVKNAKICVNEKVYNIDNIFDYPYNAAAACAFANALNILDNIAVSAIKNTNTPFGRMQRIKNGNYTVLIEMIKNVASLETFYNYVNVSRTKGILIMSIWDPDPIVTEWMEHTDFAPLFSHFDKIYTSGTCRTAKTFLRYPNVEWLEKKEICRKILHSNSNVTVLTDYDGTISIQNLLAAKGVLNKFWKD